SVPPTPPTAPTPPTPPAAPRAVSMIQRCPEGQSGLPRQDGTQYPEPLGAHMKPAPNFVTHSVLNWHFGVEDVAGELDLHATVNTNAIRTADFKIPLATRIFKLLQVSSAN